jgi:ABC-2 type transport system permease protein
LGRPIKGPSAFSGDPRRFATLTVHLAVLEWKLRFFGSALGYLWQLLRPLLLFGVLYVVFTEFVRFGEGVTHYPQVLLMGIVLFTFFSDATSRALTAVLDNESMVRKIQFPRLVVPLSVVLTALFNLAGALVAVLVFLVAGGIQPRLGWLLFVPLLAMLVLLAAGAAMLLSALFPRFRDLKPIWEVALQVLFYGTPILYVIETVPNRNVQELIMLNPLAAILEQIRHSVIDPTAPTAAQAIGGAERLLIPAAILVGVVAIGLWTFAREAPRIAEEL